MTARSSQNEAGARTQHTPGPWEFRHLSDLRRPLGWIDTATSNAIIQLEGCSEEGNLSFEANAHLIAAAPELLEACKALISPKTFGQEGHIDFHTAVKMAQDAIEKAGAK